MNRPLPTLAGGAGAWTESPAGPEGAGEAGEIVRNVTRGVVLAGRAEIARGFFARGRGLLGRVALPEGEALVIAPCGSIHTLGMRFAIDVLFVDGRHSPARCLAVARALPPGRVGPMVRGARGVIELPAGGAGPSEVGDAIEWGT